MQSRHDRARRRRRARRTALGSVFALGALRLVACGSDANDARPVLDAGADSDPHVDAASGAGGASDAGVDGDADAGSSCPLLIKYGLDIPSPDFVASHAATIDAMPFDGLVVTLPSLSASIQRQVLLDAAAVSSALEPLSQTALAQVRHNFVRVLATNAGSFDDYAVPAANFRALAAAAESAKLEGVLFDNEEYFPELGSVWGPSACSASDPAACQPAARAAGKLVMSEMIAAWPSITVIVLYGPWVSEPKTSDFFSGYFPYNDVSWANPLMGPFVVGMLEATVGTAARLVDGGELYAIREKAGFDRAYSWLHFELPKQSALIPSSLAAAYPTAISVAFGVMDESFRAATMDAAIWQSTLENALTTADRYVWAYTEQYDWWGVGWPQGGPPPQAWLDATSAARTAALNACGGN